MKSLNQVSQEIADDELIDDVMFVKRLVQDNNFKVFHFQLKIIKSVNQY